MPSAMIFNFLIESTLWGSLLIGLVLLARRFFRKAVGSRLQYFAWFLVAVRLLVPISLPNPLMNAVRPANTADATLRPIAEQVHGRLAAIAADAARVTAQSNASPLDGGNLYQTDTNLLQNGFMQWAVLAYLGIALLVLAFIILRNARFYRHIRKNRVGVLPGDLLSAYHELCKQRRTKPLPVYLVDALPGACLIGVLRPYIALPLCIPKSSILPSLTHEICHHKARDEWWNAVRILCCVVQWFNPLVWIAARASKTDAEFACDDRVTSQLSQQGRIAYAHTLVQAATPKAAPDWGVLATGMSMKGKNLKQRIRDIVSNRRVTIGVIVVFTAIATAALLIAFANHGSTARQYANRSIAISGVLYPSTQEQRAMRYTITTADEAAKYFLRLLNSSYVNARGDVSVPAERIEDIWHVREENGDGTELVATFDQEGVITAFANVGAMAGTLQNAAAPYTLSDDDNSIEVFIRGFVYGYLPDVTIASLRIVSDQTNDAGRFVTVQTDTQYAAPAHEFIVQVDPTPKILRFRLLADEDQALIRTSQKAAGDDAQAAADVSALPDTEITQEDAVEIALRAVMEAYDIPAGEADAFTVINPTYYTDEGYTWYGLTPEPPYWHVEFARPETDETLFVDYSVILDATTGEVLQIRDPSNVSNG